MTWLLSRLALPFVAPALLAALLASAGGLGLTWWHLSQEKSSNATLTADLAVSRQETADQKTALADFHAQVEKDRADANAKALAVQTGLQAQITDLTSKNNAAQRARAAASDELLKVLHAIPPEKQAAVSPGVRDFLCRVRVQQGGTDPATCATASGNTDQDRVPAPPQ